MDPTELGAALREWRARLSPGEVGLPLGSRRRTPGLRREEVARLAGVSVDYITRLEQGRGARPSESVLRGLVRALRLSGDERDHLFHLAGYPPAHPGTVTDTVRPGVLRLLDRLHDLPALVLNARSDVLAWNAMAEALLGDLATVPDAERNVARMHFGPAPHRLVADAEEQERLDRAAVADLRAAAARYPDDPALRDLVAELRAANPTFDRLWRQRPVEIRRGDRKAFPHPVLGTVELDCDTLDVPGDDLHVVVYSAAPGTRADEALALLRTVGTREFPVGRY